MPTTDVALRFESPRLYLVPHEPEDWMAMHRLATDPAMMVYISGGLPFEPERTQTFVNRQIPHLAEHGFSRWKVLLRETGEYVGLCGAEYKLLDGERVPEIGWWIAREHWGKGLASEAAERAFQHLWTVIGLPRLVSCAFPENAPSIRIMRKLGLQFEKFFDEPSIDGSELYNLVLYSINR